MSFVLVKFDASGKELKRFKGGPERLYDLIDKRNLTPVEDKRDNYRWINPKTKETYELKEDSGK